MKQVELINARTMFVVIIVTFSDILPGESLVDPIDYVADGGVPLMPGM